MNYYVVYEVMVGKYAYLIEADSEEEAKQKLEKLLEIGCASEYRLPELDSCYIKFEAQKA